MFWLIAAQMISIHFQYLYGNPLSCYPFGRNNITWLDSNGDYIETGIIYHLYENILPDVIPTNFNLLYT